MKASDMGAFRSIRGIGPVRDWNITQIFQASDAGAAYKHSRLVALAHPCALRHKYIHVQKAAPTVLNSIVGAASAANDEHRLRVYGTAVLYSCFLVDVRQYRKGTIQRPESATIVASFVTSDSLGR